MPCIDGAGFKLLNPNFSNGFQNEVFVEFLKMRFDAVETVTKPDAGKITLIIGLSSVGILEINSFSSVKKSSVSELICSLLDRTSLPEKLSNSNPGLPLSIGQLTSLPLSILRQEILSLSVSLFSKFLPVKSSASNFLIEYSSCLLFSLKFSIISNSTALLLIFD